MQSFYLLLLAAGASACATSKRLATGDYSETRGPNVILFSGRELCLNPDQTFTYAHWSDDISSSRYGTGTYWFTHKKLRLVFENTIPSKIETQSIPLVVRPDSIVLTFLVQSLENPAIAVPLAGVTILARTASLPIVGVATDATGHATLRLGRSGQSAMLAVSSVGFLTWQQACPAGNTAYKLQLPMDLGTPYEAGIVKEFWVRHHREKQLVLAQGKQVITLVAQPATSKKDIDP